MPPTQTGLTPVLVDAYLIVPGDIVDKFGFVKHVLTHPPSCPGHIHIWSDYDPSVGGRGPCGKSWCVPGEALVRVMKAGARR